ncbi:hypothetical protein [Paenibacillus assamensis]|uniref:hypothetical protein n=1 Tax=Paenibacillus assamensis TaxID=311244 RepID=UPI000685B72D|nr:hypothetical protein [Paenibacillus assamensis]
MYISNLEDKVLELFDLPQSSVGAPIPLVLSDEHTTVIAYYVQEDNYSELETVAIVTFSYCKTYMFGSPNDEAFSGHPLYSIGLRPYSTFLIQNSSWIKQLIRMNEVHPNHDVELFSNCNHYVLSFHDSTFECIAQSYKYETVQVRKISDAIETMKMNLE